MTLRCFLVALVAAPVLMMDPTTSAGAHCTGVEAVYPIRELAGLTRETCMVGAVGASYSLDKGINPLRIAR